MSNDNVTPTQVLLPVIMVSVVVFLFLAFQTVILTEDHINFTTALTQQQPMVEQVEKVKTQLNALAVGTLKLSQLGDKDAMNIIEQLKKAGVNVGDPSAPMVGPMGAMPSPSTPMASAPPVMTPVAAPAHAPTAAMQMPAHPAVPAK